MPVKAKMSETTSQNEQFMRDYLLGKLEAGEAAARENVWFDSDGETERLEAVRAELVDEFLTGSLSAGESRNFERNFLASPHNANLVAITKIQRELIDKKKIAAFDVKVLPVNSAAKNNVSAWQKTKDLFSFRMPQLALAASVLVVVFGLVFALRFLRSGEGEIAQVVPPTATVAPSQTVTSVLPTPFPTAEVPVSQQPTPVPAQRKNNDLIKPAAPDTRPAATPQPSPPQAPTQRSSIAAFALVLGVRGEGASQPKTLQLNKETKTARFSYDVPALMDDYTEFSISVIDEKSGRSVFGQKLPDLNLRQRGEKLFSSIPANVFETGSYQFVLSGKPKDKDREVLTRSSFRVQKK